MIGRIDDDRVILDMRTVPPTPTTVWRPRCAPSSDDFVVGTAGHIDHGKTTLLRASRASTPIGCPRSGGAG